MATDSLIRRLGSSLKNVFTLDEQDLFDGEATGIAVWDDESNVTINLPSTVAELSSPTSSRSLEMVWKSALRALPDDGRSWPRSNPAFTETLFVELLKIGQTDRAFSLLAEECQDAWGSAQHFAKAAGQNGMEAVVQCTIRSCRFTTDWIGTVSKHSFSMVAELEVLYVLSIGKAQQQFRKTVHLAAQNGTWKCIYFPPK